ncbi:MAG: methyltransferase domain-containing protein, partial [Myxococcota bacterium]
MTTGTGHRPSSVLERQSRYVLLGGIAADRRVLDIGGDAPGLFALAEAGAAELTCATDEPDTVITALREAEVEGVDVVPMPSLPMPFDDDAFDLVICYDLGGRLVENDAWRDELRRILTDGGYLVMALAHPGGQTLSDLLGKAFMPPLSYQEAFDKLSKPFGTLTLLGQSPVVANLFYDFESEEEDPDLVLDRSLLPDEEEEPGWYILIFGPEAVHRDDLTIVQVPFEKLTTLVRQSVLHVAPERTDGIDPAAIDDARDAADRFRAERDVLAGRIAEMQEEIERHRENETAAAAAEEEKTALEHIEPVPTAREPTDVGANAVLLAAAEQVIERQEDELRQASLRIAITETSVATARFEAEQASTVADDHWAELHTVRQRSDELNAEIEQIRGAHTEATHEVAVLKKTVVQLESQREHLTEHQDATHDELRQAKHAREEVEAARRGLEEKIAELKRQIVVTREEAVTTAGQTNADAEDRIQQAGEAAAERVEAADEKLAAADERFKEVEGEIAQVREQAESLTNERIVSLEIELDAARAQAESLTNERIVSLEV